MAGDLSDPRVYDQASPEDRLAFLHQQLAAIALAARQAVARGDGAGLANILALYKTVARRAVELTAAVNQSSAPSRFLQSLASFSDDAVSFGKGIGGAFADVATQLQGTVDALLSSTRTTLNLLPWLLLAAGIVIVIVLLRASGVSISARGVNLRR